MLVFLILLFLTISIFAYEWQNIGPADLEVHNFYVWGGGIAYEIICTSTGLLVNQDGDWESYSFSNLPVWDVETVTMATADLLVVMGDGTYSDGVYCFNFINHEFILGEYFIHPEFIEYFHADSSYYVGGEQGLMKSEDGATWGEVEFFEEKYCFDMVAYENHYVVSTDDGVFYSNDSGENWLQSESYESLSDMVFSSSGILYGIFPDESWSSGLWSSNDFGQTWNVEFWSVNLKSVGFDCNQMLFVGWDEANAENEGIANWTMDIWELSFFNEGLPNLNINKIMSHPILDCINMLCCTDGGVYLLTDYQTSNSDPTLPKPEFELSNYPNPFNPSTEIRFTVKDAKYAEDAKIEIYNIKGQKVVTLSGPRQVDCIEGRQAHSLSWNGRNNKNVPVTSGIYFYKLKVGKQELVKKMVLMK